MSLTKEEKIKIAARAFYSDNREEYSSFDQAVEEMGKTSERFIDGVVEMNTQRKEGASLMLSPLGIMVNLYPDGYVEFVSNLNEEEAEALTKESRIAIAKFPPETDVTPEDVFVSMGWKKI